MKKHKQLTHPHLGVISHKLVVRYAYRPNSEIRPMQDAVTPLGDFKRDLEYAICLEIYLEECWYE